jgi:anaerobic selenocysteine-containing dehydrogenase
MYGESTRGFDPRTIDGSKCVMIWGANPSTSAPHVHQYWLSETRVPKIVIDPIRHETAAAADMHLQLYPGTDGALAFAMLHAICAASRVNRPFLAAHSLGWEEIEYQLDVCTPAWGEAMTGVPARLIEDAALLYAEGPSLLWMGQGFQRQSFGGNAMRAVALLPAATGNIGKYGAGFLYLNGWDARGVDAGYLTAAHLKPTSAHSISHMDLTRRLESLRPKQSSRGTTTSPSRAPSSDACGEPSSAKPCCKSRSICSRPIPPTMPTMCFRLRASSSSMTWSCRISTPASRRK